jgi:hypothetical protein
LPEPRDLGEPIVAAEKWRDVLADDEALLGRGRKRADLPPADH